MATNKYWSLVILTFFCVSVAVQVYSQDYCLSAAKSDALQVEIKKWENALRDRRYADLDPFLNGLVAAYENGEKDDDTVERWFRIFRRDSPALEPLHLEWIKLYPDSFAAHLAAAEYYSEVAHAKRGSRFAKDTSETQFKAMAESHALALSFLDRAEKLTKKPTLAIASRIYIMRSVGKRADVVALFERGERIDPRNIRVKAAFISSSSPKWGGSNGELEKLLAATRASNLSAGTKTFVEYLVVYEFADEVWRDERYADAISFYERANRLCPAVEEILQKLLRLYSSQKQYTDMRQAADRYVNRRPESGWGYSQRAWANYYLSNMKSAMVDAERASAYGDSYGTYLLGWFYDKGKSTVARDANKALELYTTALSRGYARAQPDVARLRAELGK